MICAAERKKSLDRNQSFKYVTGFVPELSINLAVSWLIHSFFNSKYLSAFCDSTLMTLIFMIPADFIGDNPRYLRYLRSIT